MKKAKQKTKTIPVFQPAAGYAGQNFAQGRGGHQSGHDKEDGENFNQFQNTGNAGFASEHRINSAEMNKPGKK